MNNLTLTIAACVVVASASPALADEPLFVQVPAGVDPAASIPEAVKNECSIDMLLGNYVLSSIGRSRATAQSAQSQEQAGNNKFVQLTVLSVHGYGGGGWSGPKSINMRVDLRQGDAILGSTVLSRSSTGGAFGGFKGTCDILERVATTLGKDVAKWITRLSQTGAVSKQPIPAEPPASGE